MWINLQKETNFHDNLEYDDDITEILRKNQDIDKEILNITSNKNFYNESFYYLKKIYNQNPVPEETTLQLMNNYRKTTVDLYYNLTNKKNIFDLKLHYKSDTCLIDNTFFNISRSSIYYLTEDFVENATNCLLNYMATRQKTDFVFLGTDHALSLLTLKAAKKLNPKSKIGLFVFDEHVDIYGLEDKENLVNKANVFGKILLEDYADYTVFLGASDIAKNITETSVSENFTRWDIFGRISIYSDYDLKSKNPRHILSRDISEMRRRGITNIMISVDVDVLPSSYTGFEYSMLAPAIAALRYNGINRTQTLAEFQEGFSIGLESQDLKQYIRFIKYHTLKNGIDFGVNNGTNKLFGDVQELLSMQDANFETTKAAKIITDSFFN